MKKFLQDFKKFALRGNVLDLAVGVIIGGAFTGIVTALTTNFINPLLNVILTGTPGMLGEVAWTWGVAVSAFLTTVVNFIITAFVLFCLIRGINKLTTLNKKEEAPAAPTTKKCPFCKSAIADDATRCPHCTSQLG